MNMRDIDSPTNIPNIVLDVKFPPFTNFKSLYISLVIPLSSTSISLIYSLRAKGLEYVLSLLSALC